jgi:hypothetical protein
MVKVLFPPTTKTIEQMSIIKKVWNTIVLEIAIPKFTNVLPPVVLESFFFG